METFKKRFFGKWVLAGEHSVLRKYPALVYPLPHYYIDLEYKESEEPLKVKRKGKYQLGLELSVVSLFEKALKRVGKKREDLTGSLKIEGFIPFRRGLGASSVICAGMASLFLHKKWIAPGDLKDFAISLEDFFHGKSSGMDISVVLENQALYYKQGEESQKLPPFQNPPLLFLSYSGGSSSTSVGVAKVKTLFESQREEGERIDKRMEQSVNLCLQALKEKDSEKCREILKEALDLGEDCFRRWKLISRGLEKHMKHLKDQGALAVKPTGSGLGGHVISLWEKAPRFLKELIPLKI